ncbi:UNVERIFIED_CONTAM: hypothetical protein FKN15_058063 [Acipenser sinensis]
MVRGLKNHQGRKMLEGEGEGPHIDQYFLRSQSSQRSAIQRQDAHHSSQDISTPVIDDNTSNRTTACDETNGPGEPSQRNQPRRGKNLNNFNSSLWGFFQSGRGQQPINIRLSVMAVTRRGGSVGVRASLLSEWLRGGS